MGNNKNFVIVTDSACDLPLEYYSEHNITCLDLNFNFESEAHKDHDMPAKDFYKRMRDGEVARTSAANPADFTECFTPFIEAGKDILYICFDSSLSTTVNSANIAAEDLLEEHPDRKILIIDSLCASAGMGLLVYETVKQYEAGKTLQECYDFAMELKPTIAHRFTVETLTYLQRGGRVSAASAFAGNLLNIKPVLHVDDEGRLIPLAKARGRRKSLDLLVDAFGETALDYEKNTIIISHADSLEDALYVENLLKDRYNATTDMITGIGPVIGAHSGPGTIALFFLAKKR